MRMSPTEGSKRNEKIVTPMRMLIESMPGTCDKCHWLGHYFGSQLECLLKRTDGILNLVLFC